MTLHADLAWSHVAPALRALDAELVPGLQVFGAADVAAQHHPPLNPDVAALLLALDLADARALRRVLLNQYAGAHPVRIVRGTAQAVVVEDATLDALSADSIGGGAETWTALFVPALGVPGGFETFQETIAHLRAPEGCPWDRKQTHASLRPYLLEETYEVLDALDAGDLDGLREELGDLLLQIVLHSQVAVDAGEFRMADVIAGLNAKIIRRHPHVWGSVAVNGEQDVLTNWDKLKQVEKAQNGGKNGDQPPSRLAGVSKALPALSQAFTYQDRAARVHFDWDTVEPVIAKIHEEIGEVGAAETDAEREAEIGDLLFAVVNWARWLGVDPESALRDTNARFFRRFRYIEEQVAAQGGDFDTLTLAEMDVIWEEAKAHGL